MATITPNEPKNVTEAAGPSPMPNQSAGGLDYGSVPSLSPVTNIQEQLSGEAAKYQGPGRWWDQLAEKADWAYYEAGPFASMVRGYLQRNTTTSKKWSAQELNEFYKDQGVTFTDAEYPEIAALRVAQRKKEVRLNDYVSRGGSFGFGSELLASSVQVFDPINMSLNYLGGRFLTPLAVNKLGMNAQTFGSMFLENAVTNLAADVPTYFQLKKEFSEQTFGEMAAGSLLGAGISAGIGSLLHAKLSKAKPAAASAIADAVGKQESGAKIDTNSAKFLGAERENGEVQPGSGIPKTGPAYEAVAHPSEVPFFANKRAGVFESDGEYGTAVYASDSAYAANNKGHFSELRISKDAKFLNVESPMADPDADVFKMAIEMKMDRFGVRPIEMKEGASVKDFIRRLEVEEDAGNLPKGVTAQQLVRETAQELGYHGIADVHRVNGEPRFNKVTIFDKTKLEEGKFYQQNADFVPKASPDDLARQHEDWVKAQQNREFYDPELIQELDHLKSKPNMTPEEVKTFLKQQEVRTRADLKKLISKADDGFQFNLLEDQQIELGIPKETPVEDLLAHQREFEDVMAQIDEFLDKEKFKEVISRVSEDELGKMKQVEMDGLRGTATRKPTLRRSNLPDKDVLARMSAEEYRKSIQAFADEQPDMFGAYFLKMEKELNPQGEFNLSRVPLKNTETDEFKGFMKVFDDFIEQERKLDDAKIYNATEERLLPDGTVTKTVIPPEAPTPQTRKIVGGVAHGSAEIDKNKPNAVSKNIKEPNERVLPDLTEEQLAQIRNHKMTDKTRALIEEKIAEIDAEHELEMQKVRSAQSFIDCIAQGIT